MEFTVLESTPGFTCDGVSVAPGQTAGTLDARNWGVVGGDGAYDDRPEFAACPGDGLGPVGDDRRDHRVAPVGARAVRLGAAQAGFAGWE